MNLSTNQRKHDHLQTFRRDPDVERHKHYFDAIHLTHRALPEIALDEVDPSTNFLGKRLSFPLLISSMTGGSEPIFQKINRNLVLAAEAEGVALGVGSQRVMFATPAARKSFELRRYAPTAPLLANLGAVQLNYGFGLAECRAAVAALKADALILHLNPLQEAIQREGDTDFRGLASKVGKSSFQCLEKLMFRFSDRITGSTGFLILSLLLIPSNKFLPTAAATCRAPADCSTA